MTAIIMAIRPPAVRMRSRKPATLNSTRIRDGSVARSQLIFVPVCSMSSTMPPRARDRDQ